MGATKKMRRSVGRPTIYKPEYCEEVIELMAGGYSIAAVAGKLRVSRQTVYDWGDAHPEFLDALNVARAASALWWEDRAVALAKGGEGNASVVIFGLKNRVADEWRDKQEYDHRSSDGSMTPKGVPDDLRTALDAIAGKLAGSDGAGEVAGDGKAGADSAKR